MSLIAHYKFEDDLTDETGDYDASSAGSISYESDGQDGKALSMSSGNNGFDTSQSLGDVIADASEWTIDMWVKASDLDHEWNCLFRGDAYAYFFGESAPSWAADRPLSIHTNFTGTGSASCTPANSISSGEWYRITFVREDGHNKIYIDGSLELDFEGADHDFDAAKWGYDGYSNQDFAGLFDEIKIYDSAEVPPMPEVEVSASETLSLSEATVEAGIIVLVDSSKEFDNWKQGVVIY